MNDLTILTLKVRENPCLIIEETPVLDLVFSHFQDTRRENVTFPLS